MKVVSLVVGDGTHLFSGQSDSCDICDSYLVLGKFVCFVRCFEVS